RHCGRSRDGGRRRITGEGDELRRGVREIAPTGVDGLTVVYRPRTPAGPAIDGIRRPFRRTIPMAPRARVRSSDRDREVRTGHAQAVIAPRVHAHVGPRGHVAFDAGGPGRSGAMVMMFGRVELCGQVAA